MGCPRPAYLSAGAGYLPAPLVSLMVQPPHPIQGPHRPSGGCLRWVMHQPSPRHLRPSMRPGMSLHPRVLVNRPRPRHHGQSLHLQLSLNQSAAWRRNSGMHLDRLPRSLASIAGPAHPAQAEGLKSSERTRMRSNTSQSKSLIRSRVTSR